MRCGRTSSCGWTVSRRLTSHRERRRALHASTSTGGFDCSTSSDGGEKADDRGSFVIAALSPAELRDRLEAARADAAADVAREQRSMQKCLAGDPDHLYPGLSIEESNAQAQRSIDKDTALVQACDAVLDRLDGELTAAGA